MNGSYPIALDRFVRAVTRSMLFTVAVAIVLVPTPASAQSEEYNPMDEMPSIWRSLRGLEGSWEGEIDGKWGTGRGVREFKIVVGGKYLQVRHSSVRPPQPATPEGDEHEELGVFSYDQQRGLVAYREFLGEGYVTRYRCTAAGDSIVCESEDIENGPDLQTRLVLVMVDNHHFIEIYEIGRQGKELERWFTNHWRRIPELRN